MEEKKNNQFEKIDRGEVFYLKNLSITLVVISNKLHNLFSDFLVFNLLTDKSIEKVHDSLELAFKLKEQKLKILVNCFYTLKKKTLQKRGVFLGKLDKKVTEQLNNKIRSIL